MVADFVSPDYGWLRGKTGYVVIAVRDDASADFSCSEDSARVLFKAGKTQDGYFMNDEILEQANHVMVIIDKDYPDDDHVFFYDNAKTHTARCPDALSA